MRMELVIGNKYECKATKILPYGAVMEMEDGTTQLLHISNISYKYVSDVGEFIQVGKTYTVRAVKGKVRDVEITLKEPKDPREDRPKQPRASFQQDKKDPPRYYDSQQFKNKARNDRRKSKNRKQYNDRDYW